MTKRNDSMSTRSKDMVSPLVRNVTISLVCLTLATVMVGCGGGSSNDQGVSVTLLGFNYDTEEQAPCEGTEPNEAGRIIPLSTNADSAGGIISGYVVQNRMTSQFFRTENAFLSYFIPGALEQPPSTAVATGAVIEAAPAVATDTEGSRGCIGGFVLPPEIQSWIVNNRSSMPELPFQVEVTAYISGITSAGDRLDTNQIKYFVELTQDIIVDSEGEGGGDSGLGGGSEAESSGDATTGSDVGSEGEGTDADTSLEGSEGDGSDTDTTGDGTTGGTDSGL